MASENNIENALSTVSDPNFAVVCSFFEKFGPLCGVTVPDFEQLQLMLENTHEVPVPLFDLNIKLLRKAVRCLHIERWERSLIKFCHTYSSQDAWEIERFGYKKARTSVKLSALKALCEAQFDKNMKFKNEINKLQTDELRLEPFGKDKKGLSYWYQADEAANIRVYRENPDEETWEVIAKNKAELVALISELSGESNGPSESITNEDSNSLEIEKPIVDTGQLLSEENSKETSHDSEDSKEETEDNEEIQPTVEKLILKVGAKSDISIVKNDAKRKRESDDEDEEVSEEIIEDPLIVQGEGSGEDCDAGNPICGDEVCEDVMYFFGEGSGAECLTANTDQTKEEESASSSSLNNRVETSAKTPSFFFGPGSLSNKLPTDSKVVKSAPNRTENETNVNCLTNSVDTNGESELSKIENPKEESNLGLKENTKSEEKILPNDEVKPEAAPNQLCKQISKVVTHSSVDEKPGGTIEKLDECKAAIVEKLQSKVEITQVENKLQTSHLESNKTSDNDSSLKSLEVITSEKVNKTDKEFVSPLDTENSEKGVTKRLEPKQLIDEVSTKKPDSEKNNPILNKEVELSNPNSETLTPITKLEKSTESKKLGEKTQELVNPNLESTKSNQTIEPKTLPEETLIQLSNVIGSEVSNKSNIKPTTEKSQEALKKQTDVKQFESEGSTTGVGQLIKDVNLQIKSLETTESTNTPESKILENNPISDKEKIVELEKVDKSGVTPGQSFSKIKISSGNEKIINCSDKQGPVVKPSIKNTKDTTETKTELEKKEEKIVKSNILKIDVKAVPKSTNIEESKNLTEESKSVSQKLEAVTLKKVAADSKKSTKTEESKNLNEDPKMTSQNPVSHPKKLALTKSEESKILIKNPKGGASSDPLSQESEVTTINKVAADSKNSTKLEQSINLTEELKITSSNPVSLKSEVKNTDEDAKNSSKESKNPNEELKVTSIKPVSQKSKETNTAIDTKKSTKLDSKNLSEEPNVITDNPVSQKSEIKIINKIETDSKLVPETSDKFDTTILNKSLEHVEKGHSGQESKDVIKPVEVLKKTSKKSGEKITNENLDFEKTIGSNLKSKTESKTISRQESTDESKPTKIDKLQTKSVSTKPATEIKNQTSLENETTEDVKVTNEESDTTGSINETEESKSDKKEKSESKVHEELKSQHQKVLCNEESKKDLKTTKPNNKKHKENEDLEPKLDSKKLEENKTTTRSNLKKKQDESKTESQIVNEKQNTNAADSPISESSIPVNYAKTVVDDIPIESEQNATNPLIKVKDSKVKSQEIEKKQNPKIETVSKKEDNTETLIEKSVKPKDDDNSNSSRVVGKSESKKNDTKDEDTVPENSKKVVSKSERDGSKQTDESFKSNSKSKTVEGRTTRSRTVPEASKIELRSKTNSLSVKDSENVKPQNLKNNPIVNNVEDSNPKSKNNNKIGSDDSEVNVLKSKDSADGEVAADKEPVQKTKMGKPKRGKTAEPDINSEKEIEALTPGKNSKSEEAKPDEPKEPEPEEQRRRSLRVKKEVIVKEIKKPKMPKAKKTKEPPEESKEQPAETIEVKTEEIPRKPLLMCVDINKLKAKPEAGTKLIKPMPIKTPSPSPSPPPEIIDLDSPESDNDPLDGIEPTLEDNSRKRSHTETIHLDEIDEVDEPKKARTRKQKMDLQNRKVVEEKKMFEMICTNSSDDEVELVEDESKEKSETRPRNQVAKRGGKRGTTRSTASSKPEEEPAIKMKPMPKSVALAKAKQLEKEREQEETASTKSQEEESTKEKTTTKEKTISDSKTKTVEAAKPRKPRKPKLMGLDIPEDDVLDVGETPVRQSRRIAQIKIKEEAERRKLEELALDEITKSKTKKVSSTTESSKKRKGKNDSDEESSQSEDESNSQQSQKKRKKAKKELTFNERRPWQSSSGSDSDEEEAEPEIEEEIYSEEEPRTFHVLKSDHEFSPESDLEDEETGTLPTRRARTAKVSDEEEDADDHACQKCGKSDHPEWILLCDSCDCGWHCSCLRPAIFVIPEGDWYCPPCQHTTLISRLKLKLEDLIKIEKKIATEALKKERDEYFNISMANVIAKGDKANQGAYDDEDEDVPSRKRERRRQSYSGSSDGSSSGSGSDSGSTDGSSEPIYQLRQRRQANSYKFNEYDDLINSAIQDELEAVKGAGNQGRGKDINTIIDAEKEEAQAEQEEAKATGEPGAETGEEKTENVEEKTVESNEEDEDEIPPVVRRKAKKKSNKLTSLDVVSDDDDQNSDEDFKGSSSSEEDFDEETGSDDSEFGGRNRSGPVRRSTRARATRYDADFINDDSDDMKRSRKKKSRSIWDESESEESDASWGRKKKRGGGRKNYSRPSQPKKVFWKPKKKKNRLTSDNESDVEKKPKRPKIKYGGLTSEEETDISPVRRTRGKKINYVETMGSDSEEDTKKSKARPIIESEEEYVAEEEDPSEDTPATENPELPTEPLNINQENQPPQLEPEELPQMPLQPMELPPMEIQPTNLQPMEPLLVANAEPIIPGQPILENLPNLPIPQTTSPLKERLQMPPILTSPPHLRPQYEGMPGGSPAMMTPNIISPLLNTPPRPTRGRGSRGPRSNRGARGSGRGVRPDGTPSPRRPRAPPGTRGRGRPRGSTLVTSFPDRLNQLLTSPPQNQEFPQMYRDNAQYPINPNLPLPMGSSTATVGGSPLMHMGNMNVPTSQGMPAKPPTGFMNTHPPPQGPINPQAPIIPPQGPAQGPMNPQAPFIPPQGPPQEQQTNAPMPTVTPGSYNSPQGPINPQVPSIPPKVPPQEHTITSMPSVPPGGYNPPQGSVNPHPPIIPHAGAPHKPTIGPMPSAPIASYNPTPGTYPPPRPEAYNPPMPSEDHQSPSPGFNRSNIPPPTSNPPVLGLPNPPPLTSAPRVPTPPIAAIKLTPALPTTSVSLLTVKEPKSIEEEKLPKRVLSDDEDMEEEEEEEEESEEDEEDMNESDEEDEVPPAKSLLSNLDSDELEGLDEEELAELMAEEAEYQKQQKLKAKKEQEKRKEQAKLKQEQQKKQSKPVIKKQQVEKEVGIKPSQTEQLKMIEPPSPSVIQTSQSSTVTSEIPMSNESNSSFKSEESKTSDASYPPHSGSTLPNQFPPLVPKDSETPPTKRRGRGKGKKTLAAEAAAAAAKAAAEAKVVPEPAPSKLGIAPPPQPFSQASQPSVITRMLQAPHFGQQSYFNPGLVLRGAPGYRPPFIPVTNPRLPAPPGAPVYHTPHHPMDPSPSGGGPITIASSDKPPAAAGSPIPPPRIPNYPYPQNYYPGYPPPTEDVPPAVYPPPPPAAPYEEVRNPETSDNSNSNKPFEEEGGGEFGGLVSYFSSQREDDIDT